MGFGMDVVIVAASKDAAGAIVSGIIGVLIGEKSPSIKKRTLNAPLAVVERPMFPPFGSGRSDSP